MLARREFTRKPRRITIVITLLLFVALLICAIVALTLRVNVSSDVDVAKVMFLRIFGGAGIAVFVPIVIYLVTLLARTRKVRGPSLILDEKALLYGGFRVPWGLMREAIVCRVLMEKYVGIRTVNDRAFVKKIDEALKHVPGPFLLGLHYRLWRSQCSVVVPTMDGISTEELCDLIEQYRKQYRTADPTANTTAIAGL